MPLATPGTSPSMSTSTSSGANKSLKIRLSCDRCQTDKVRCSRDKPSCKRCERRQLECVYSPFRHIGRPRRNVAESAHEAQGDQDMEDVDDSPESVVRTLAGSSPSDSLGRSAGSTAATSLDGSCVCGHDAGVAPNASSQQLELTSHGGDDELLRAAVNVWAHGHQLQLNTPPESQQYGTPQSRRAQESQDELGCYTTILRRTLELEGELSSSSATPPIDLVLEAESEYSGLQSRIFTCSGHHPSLRFAPISASEPLCQNIRASSCLTSDQPIALSLALLAERVVGMLEGLVRLAAHSAQSSDRANEVLWSSPAAQDPDLTARRLQRSFRTNWVKGCVSLETDADRDLCLGNFVVQGQAKSTAMRRILKLRVRRMLAALEALQAMSTTAQAGNNKRDQFSASPLDWGGSGAVLGKMADALLTDLRRRMESVQGAVMLF
ncbi:hypothetical protein F4678DRAFT_228603 [Xylaria arbuscula]|nr:hypothetical protein F4678DRAFT_228603 [Xylaria arbuscula]